MRYMDAPRNNFDALRLLLAWSVVVSHSFTLAPHTTNWEPLMRASGQLNIGSVAVGAFFIISGFLITQSWLKSRGLADYLNRRVRCFYPGYMVAIFFGALVVSPLAATDWRATLAPQQWRQAATAAALLNIYNAPQTLQGIPSAGELNGSLWSVHYEFVCYLLLAGLGLVGVLRRRWLVASLFILTVLVHATIDIWQIPIPMPRWLALIVGWPVGWPGCAAYFMGGACFYFYRARIPHHGGLAALALAAFVVGCFVPRSLLRVMEIGGAYLVFWVAFHPGLRLHDFAKWMGGDYSYGTYLYAFPIQQMMAYWWGSWLTPQRMILLATPAALAAGWLSWHLVEKRFMKQRVAEHRAPAGLTSSVEPAVAGVGVS